MLRYVEPLSEARTPPGTRRVSARRGRAGEKSDFFSILLGAAAFRTQGGFFRRFTFFGGQGEELFALPAGANFEVGSSLIVDMGGQEQFQRIISDRAAVGEFDDGQAVVKDLEGSFLPFSGQYMSENEYRLSLTLRAEVS
jgi:hypothetical protein